MSTISVLMVGVLLANAIVSYLVYEAEVERVGSGFIWLNADGCVGTFF